MTQAHDQPTRRPTTRPSDPGPLRASWPRLVLLRHGVTTYPPGTYLGSRIDPPLSPMGERQALGAGGALARLSLSVVAVSPLRRAMETAALAIPPSVPQERRRVDARLQEQDLGDYGGLTWDEIKRLDRDAARAWRLGAAAPGGESAGQMWQRTLEAALEIVTDLPTGAAALLVSHNGPIRALLAAARDLPPSEVRRIRVPHGSLRSVRVTPTVLRRWREAASRT